VQHCFHRESVSPVRAPVHLVAAQRMPRFGQVNADLVGASRLELAFDDRISVEPLDRFHVRDGPFAQLRMLRTPAATVPPVRNEIRCIRLGADISERHGQIDPVQAVVTELRSQQALGINRAAKIIRPLVSRSMR